MDNFCTPKRTKPESRIDTPFVTIPPSPFLKKLGFGTGVGVYKLERSPQAGKTHSPWAIKKLLRCKLLNTEYNTRLQEEANILRKLNHPNIIGFRAHLTARDNSHCLAMEECNSCLGDMIESRHEKGSTPFPVKSIMKVAWDISDALTYLHTQAFILHGDVKSYNVLINGDFDICKLCDFGVSLPLTKEGKIDLIKSGKDVKYVGTRLWCSPETYRYPQVITAKADIYAFGLVLWEMLSLVPPRLEDLGDDEEDELEESIDDDTAFEKRPALPATILDNSYKYVLELFYCCTEESLEDRPSAQDLSISIPEMIKDLGISYQ